MYLPQVGLHPVEQHTSLFLRGGQAVGAVHVAAGEEVKLDLRLGPRGPRGEPAAGRSAWKMSEVARRLGQGSRGARPAEVPDLVLLVVEDVRERDPADLLRGAGAERFHDGLDLRVPLAALAGLGHQPLGVMPHVDVEVVQVFEHRLLAVLHGGGQFGEEQGGDGRVLVAHVHPLQVAVRLLEGEQEARRARLLDPAGDPLEADQEVVLDADPLAFGQARVIWVETRVVTR